MGPQALTGNPSDQDLQRAEGSCRIVLDGSGRTTRILDVFQRSPIRVLFPRTAGGALEEAVLINTAGGIAGGGPLETAGTAVAEDSLSGTATAAEKVSHA